MRLNTELSPASCDALFASIAEAHEGLDREQSLLFNSLVTLLLANHVGSLDVVRDTLQIAREMLDRQSRPAENLQ